jgi:hypothetical protein
MTGSPKNHLFLAILLIILGLLILFNNLGVASFDLTLGTWWPLLLIIIGLQQLVSSRFTNLFALVLLFLGVTFQLRNLRLINAKQISLFWPFLLILLGLILLFRFGSGRGRLPETSPNHTADVVVLFGGVDRRIASPSFIGGNVTALFGGAQLDLRGSQLPEGTSVLNVQAIFGGADLILPEGWTVEVRGIPIFGSIEDQRKEQRGPQDTSGQRLLINALVLFGGIELKE